MRKAGNMMEISILLGVVTVVTIGTLVVYNNQNLRLALLSAINFRPVNMETMNQDTARLNVPYNRVEVGGGNALTSIGWTSADFESAITHVSYGNLDDAFKPKDGLEGIDTYANNLIGNKDLGLSSYTTLSATNITAKTLSDLVGILNVITSPSIEGFKQAHPEAAGDVDGFLKRFKDILTTALADSKNATAASDNLSIAGSSKVGTPTPNAAYSGDDNGAGSYTIVSADVKAPNVNSSANSANLANSPSSGNGETVGVNQNGKIPLANNTGGSTTPSVTPSTTPSTTPPAATKKPVPVVAEDDDIIPVSQQIKNSINDKTIIKQQAVKYNAVDPNDYSYNVVTTPATTNNNTISNKVNQTPEAAGIRAQDHGGTTIQNGGF